MQQHRLYSCSLTVFLPHCMTRFIVWKKEILQPTKNTKCADMYHSLMNKRLPPTYDPIFCRGSKFTQMSAHPGASFAWLTECTCHSFSTMCYTSLKFITRRSILLMPLLAIHHIDSDRLPFKVLCAVRIQLQSSQLHYILLFVQLFALRTLSR